MTTTREGDGAVVRLAGELDISNVDGPRADLRQLLESSPTFVRFDLAELAFMDSSGLSMLLEVATKTKVEVIHASSIIRRVIEATGLAAVLGLQP